MKGNCPQNHAKAKSHFWPTTPAMTLYSHISINNAEIRLVFQYWVTNTPVKTSRSNTTSSHISSGIKTHVGLVNEVIQSIRVKTIGDGAWVVME